MQFTGRVADRATTRSDTLAALVRQAVDRRLADVGLPKPPTPEQMRERYRRRLAAGTVDPVVAVPVWRRQAAWHRPYRDDPSTCRACRSAFPCPFRLGADAALAVVAEREQDQPPRRGGTSPAHSLPD